MNEERVFTLMMDALEGVLDEAESAELQTYLDEQPELAHEWQAMQTIDAMLIATPPTALPVNFATRTLKRLPNERNRRIFMSIFYFLLLLGGLLPILGGILLSSQLGNATFGSGSIAESLQLLSVVASGMVSALRTFIINQPMIFGWLTVMLCAILLWASIFRQYSNQVQPVLIHS